MRLNSFTVAGYKNLTAPVTLAPLGDVNVLYGPNNLGKSNLVGAMDLFFRLMAVGTQVSRDQSVSLDMSEQIEGYPFAEIFTAGQPDPIRWQVQISLPEEELQRSGLEPDCPTDPLTISFELTPVPNGAQLRVTEFLLAKTDVARDSSGPVGFAETLRAFIAGTFFMGSEHTLRPFVLIDPYRPDPESPGAVSLVPQRLRDALFDTRQSLDRDQRARWGLFTRLMKELEPELGPGSFDTAFDRAAGRANLVYDRGETTLPVDCFGVGVQRMVALVGSLALARATLIGLGEPELGLAPSAQQRLLRALRTLLTIPGGPQQLFLTSHSPVFGALDSAFALELQDGVPVASRRPWEGGISLPPLPDLAAAEQPGPESPGDLDALIGLVDQLSELEPAQMVGAVASSSALASPAASSPRAAPEPASEAPEEATGTPPWKYKGKK